MAGRGLFDAMEWQPGGLWELPGYTTADILDTPINKGGILPLSEYADGRVKFDLTAGIPGSIGRAVTAPARAWRGQIDEGDLIDEGNNFAGWMTLGGLVPHASAPAKNSMMSAVKSMGPMDAPVDALQVARIAGADRFLIDDTATAFANKRLSQPTAEDLIEALRNSGMGPANSNKATAELFANSKPSSVPGMLMTDIDPLGYYSGSLRAAQNLRQAKGTPEQMLAMLKKEGAKEAEIEATGLKSLLDGKSSVTKDEIIAHLEANKVSVMPGLWGQPES